MARRSKRTGTIAYDINKMSQELRRAVLDVGMDVLGELAEKVAEEANLRAPFIEHDIALGETPLRRGPNKFGGSDSGPIKGNVFAQQSQKIPLSWLVCSPAWYSHFAEYGTSIHKMSRKSKSGKPKEFLHPGSVPRPPFLRPAADKAEQFLEQILQKHGFIRKG